MKKVWRDVREALHAALASVAVRILVGLLAALGAVKAGEEVVAAVAPPAWSSR